MKQINIEETLKKDKNTFKHTKDSDDMHHKDELVIFKLTDMKHKIAGRVRYFEDKGRWTKPTYVYIHRGDGTILQKYTYGFEILKVVKL